MIIVLPTLHVRPSAQAVSLAAASLAAALPKKLRTQARLIDLFPERDESEMLEAVRAAGPGLVAIPLYSWSRIPMLALARRFKEQCPEVPVVAGGPEATADPEGVMAEGSLDGVICGEGEETFRELAKALARGQEPPPLPGLVLKGDKLLREGAGRSPAARIEELPSPWLTGVLTPTPGGGVLWEISRGCPFSCDFCFDARGGHGVRHLPRQRLEAELDLFVRSGVSQVWVLDSTFNFPPERGKALLRLIAAKAPGIHFHLEAKADFLDRETAALLAEIPCSVQLGLQSARPEVLRNLNRSFDPRLFEEKARMLSAAGVIFGLDLIYGLPGDSHQGFRQSLLTALQLQPNHVDIFPLAVLPGTALHRDRSRYGLRAQDRPPYEILETITYGAPDLSRSRLLAAATDLFYNLGRAVAFFPALLGATGRDAVTFLEEFAAWALDRGGVERERFLVAESWQPDQILELQKAWLEHLLRQVGRQELLPAARDLVHYHFHYAETLLGEETLPAAGNVPSEPAPWNTPWQRAPGIRLVSFTYEILDLLEMGEIDPVQCSGLFRPVGSTGLFFRRGEEVFCESLQEDFLKLLAGCDGGRCPREIFAGSVPEREGREIVDFAVSEGLLVPPQENGRTKDGRAPDETQRRSRSMTPR
ncbi:radical SAM protein [uncultured Desulfuromonas sp.]|uniref:B12-binding domain-containing radical SAM protein n=1 Tax=uncultured Desulfuromonas sp. TaxID=181013 RepID=UPI0026279E25|nr:radical SAM protein [uncultured Desulfuromonas sp.]